MRESNLQLEEIKRRRQLKEVEFWRYVEDRDARAHLRLTLTDLPADPSGPDPLEVQLREIDYTDHEGNAQRVWVLASVAFDVPPVQTIRYFNDKQTVTCPAGEEGLPVIIARGIYEADSESEANALAIAAGQAQLVCYPAGQWPGVWEFASTDLHLVANIGPSATWTFTADQT